MTKTRTRAAAAVALAALAVGATACGSSHGPTSIKAALAQKPPRVPTHMTGIPGSEQRELAPLPRKLRNEIIFSGVKYSVQAIKLNKVATTGPDGSVGFTTNLSNRIVAAGEQGWTCDQPGTYPTLPGSEMTSLADQAPDKPFFAAMPYLQAHTVGFSVWKSKRPGDVIDDVLTLPSGNQALVVAVAKDESGAWKLTLVSAGQVTKCGK